MPTRFRALLAASAYVAAFAFAAYRDAAGRGEGEPVNDIAPNPHSMFDTPQDALKSLVAGLDARAHRIAGRRRR